MTYTVIPDPKGALSVCVNFDLREYLEASRKLYQAKETRSHDKKHFDEARANLIKNLPLSAQSPTSGTCWLAISKKLGSLCNKQDVNEQLLAQALDISNMPSIKMPLSLQTLADHFCELFKNSLDKKIATFLKDDESVVSTALRIHISILRPVDNDNLQIVVLDNAGGFEDGFVDGFVDKFYSSIGKQSYGVSLEKRHDSQKDVGELSKFLLGGQGIGLHGCARAIIERGGSIEMETVEPSDDSRGAKITFRSLAHHSPDTSLASRSRGELSSSASEPADTFAKKYDDPGSGRRLSTSSSGSVFSPPPSVRSQSPSLPFFNSTGSSSILKRRLAKKASEATPPPEPDKGKASKDSAPPTPNSFTGKS